MNQALGAILFTLSIIVLLNAISRAVPEERVFILTSIFVGMAWTIHSGSVDQGFATAIGLYFTSAIAQLISIFMIPRGKE